MRAFSRRSRGSVLVALAGAAAAALIAFLVIPPAPAVGPIEIPRSQLSAAASLARLADTSRQLHPIVIRAGRPVLGDGAAGPAPDVRRPAPPARLSIPAIGVEAAIEPVNGTATGVEVPAVGRAGWFAPGPRPGEPGRSVLIGHLDASNGPGLFALLPAVQNGTAVTVTDGAGVPHNFRIVGRAQIEKSKFPTYAVFGASDRPVLVMVTCGGPYTPGVGYRDNVIVYARAA